MDQENMDEVVAEQFAETGTKDTPESGDDQAIEQELGEEGVEAAADDLAGEGADKPADEASAAGEPVVGGSEAPALDPIEQKREELSMLPGDWYVIHSYSGHERRV